MKLFVSAVLIALVICSAADSAFAGGRRLATGRHGSHLGVHGPYFGLKYVGND
jgi:hypothetical protein